MLTKTNHKNPTSSRAIPELLAPAGDWECARAAVENGADAIYFGLEKFNARMRAHNFTESDLPTLMEMLHGRGVKGYVTFNTLVFENELAEAKQYLRTIIGSGVDAAIVQDVGICRMIRQLSPDFPIHVSTQMTITSAAGVQFARELGCNLVVLARECSLKEIDLIANGDHANQQSTEGNMPLEVFVHGALCVAYSGQCLTSESLGGRSANRGECAQACRLPYELIADGQRVPLDDRKYLLSPQDLAGLEVLPDLVNLKISSLKIEGRLKSPEYVANITRIYREALDRITAEELSRKAWSHESLNPLGDPHSLSPRERGRVREGQVLSSPRAEKPALEMSPENRQYEMEMAFSRGLYTGWFRGINNQKLVHAEFAKKRGVYLGKVSEVRGDQVVVMLEKPVKAGDGVVFDAGKPEEKEEGGRVYSINSINVGRGSRRPRPRNIPDHGPASHPENGAATVLTFGRGSIDFRRVHAGDRVWKTSDPELENRLRQTFQGKDPEFQRPITFEVHGALGAPLTVIAKDELGNVARSDSCLSLVPAEKQPLTQERLEQQLGRLGGTPFKLQSLQNRLAGSLLLPVSELNRLRRDIVSQLKILRAKPPRWTLAAETADIEVKPSTHRQPVAASLKLHVLVRNLPQLQVALHSGVSTIYCDFEDPKKYHEAVRLFRDARLSDSEIFVAPPRIYKMGEEWVLKLVRSSQADGYLIRNYDHLRFFDNDRRVGDYSLNIANSLSAGYFKSRFHLERVTASYDLNHGELEALVKRIPSEWLEVTIHQHMPMFHMEHCVFCAFLSDGTDYTNCGRPCDTREVKLRDRVGAEHPVKADAGCRNTVFNSRAQTGAEYVSRLAALGLRHFRIEFLNESAQEVERTISNYHQLLAGEIKGPQLWRELNLINQLGVTRGQL